MTLAEVAEALFVSRVYVEKLLKSGRLNEVLPRSPCGMLNIDANSVEKYKAECEAAKRAYLDSQNEDDAPLK
jgi:predicted site-specific integrase-resolvase